MGQGSLKTMLAMTAEGTVASRADTPTVIVPERSLPTMLMVPWEPAPDAVEGVGVDTWGAIQPLARSGLRYFLSN